MAEDEENSKYKFYYFRKAEEFFDDELYRFAVQDMQDKYFGNSEKSQKYQEALKRLNSHIVTKRFVFADGSLREGEYQTIENYSSIDSDLRLLQLEGLREKLEKTSKHAAGDKSIYQGKNDEYENDRKYIETGNFSNSRTELVVTQKNLLSLFNRFRRNESVEDDVNVIKGPKGLYDNSPVHRYKARVDYLMREEKERLAKQGKKVNTFLSLWKSRIKAVTSAGSVDKEIMNIGKKKIKENLDRRAETRLLEDKYIALGYHILYLKRTYITSKDKKERALIRRYLEIALKEKESIESDKNFDKNRIKVEDLKQTDVVTLEDVVIKEGNNVTRTVNGIKTLSKLGATYVGPNVNDWLLNNALIEQPINVSNWVKGKNGESGHFEELIEAEIVVNPRVLKICNITEQQIKR